MLGFRPRNLTNFLPTELTPESPRWTFVQGDYWAWWPPWSSCPRRLRMSPLLPSLYSQVVRVTREPQTKEAETKQKTSRRQAGEGNLPTGEQPPMGRAPRRRCLGSLLVRKANLSTGRPVPMWKKTSSHKSRVRRSKVIGAKVTTLLEQGYSLRRPAWLEDLAPLPPVICLGREAAVV